MKQGRNASPTHHTEGMDKISPDAPYTSNDLALENMMDEFDMTAADLQDLEQR